MSFKLPTLDYEIDALEPYVSKETLLYHHGKHHQGYVNKLNGLIKDTDFKNMSLEEIIQESSGAIFNNAAQHWNHSFYWNCLSPHSTKKPKDEILDMINSTFGSFEEFKKEFTHKALTTFGSGWAWLVESQNELKILSTSNAGTPLTSSHKPLLVCDVWEHAYYIDTRNNRSEYLDNFWNLVNWDFVNEKLDI